VLTAARPSSSSRRSSCRPLRRSYSAWDMTTRSPVPFFLMNTGSRYLWQDSEIFVYLFRKSALGRIFVTVTASLHIICIFYQNNDTKSRGSGMQGCKSHSQYVAFSLNDPHLECENGLEVSL